MAVALAFSIFLPTLLTAATAAYSQVDSRTFPETGHIVKGDFLQYWDSHGGLAQQGYPITEEMQEVSDTDGKTYTMQYFERAVFELHPENQPPSNVLLSLLGVFLYRQKYGTTGAPDQQPDLDTGSQLFAQTGHRLGGKFLDYWNSHGGLAQQGYPISDEFTEKSDLDGKTYQVQYFERAVFEYHPENQAPYDVLLSQLGTFRYKARQNASQQSGDPKLDQFFDQVFFDVGLRDPENFTALGVPRDLQPDFRSDRLTDTSDAYLHQTFDLLRTYRQQLSAFDPAKESPQQQISSSALAWYLDDQISYEDYMYDDYLLNPVYGVQVNLHDLMTDLQPLTGKQDADDYIARLQAFNSRIDDVLAGMRIREQKGIFMPGWMVDEVIGQIHSYIPADVKASDFYATFTTKVGALSNIGSADKETLYSAAEDAVRTSVYPAYNKLADYLTEIRPKSRDTDGVWALPGGDAYYSWLVRHHTNSNMTPQEVYDLGQTEVTRIQGEIMQALQAQGINATTLAEGTQQVIQASGVYRTGTQAGKQEVLDAFRAIIDQANTAVSADFDLEPKAALEVRGVDVGPGGYYIQPALDGSRPGVFYVNLSQPVYPKYSMPTLAYHEAVPGHHFQQAVQVELQNVPLFQKAPVFPLPTAFVEGWGLYAEKLAAEVGLYQGDPYGSIGKLKAELFRASRLVVDTGIHYKHWTREQAITYMDEANGTTGGAYTAEVERYIAWPGQALAYKTGELKILDLRRRAQDALGSKFDIKEFHDVVLGNGSIPLPALEQAVNQYISSKSK